MSHTAFVPDARLGAAGKKEAAARAHDVRAEVYRREAAALRAAVAADEKKKQPTKRAS